MIYIAADHTGVELKKNIQKYFSTYSWEDLGTHQEDPVDYPQIASQLCQKYHPDFLGILICGTGIGMSIAANRFPHIRAAVVENPWSAALAKKHNHANLLCLGSRILAPAYAYTLIEAWLTTSPDLHPRHTQRVMQLT